MLPMIVLSVVRHVIAVMVHHAANAMTGGMAHLAHPVRRVSAQQATVPDRLAGLGFLRRASLVQNVLRRNPDVSSWRVLNASNCRSK
jgi:hypothetical protein